MESKKLTFRHYLMIGSLIFGMLFGAGNLIFPVHLGQMAGSHWLSAALGFLASGVLLPVLGLLAISITQSRGIYELARPVGHSYALLFMILIYATIGPFFATPRTDCALYDRFCSTYPAKSAIIRPIDLFSDLLFISLLSV